MTVKEVIAKSMILLGYNDEQNTSTNARFNVTARNAVNFVFADILFCLGRNDYSDIKDLSEELQLPARVVYDVMPYGVAAYIAESIGDGDKQQYFASMYNIKRKTVTYEDSIQDVIPAP